MKTIRAAVGGALVMLATTSAALGQTFNPGGSGWDSGGSFAGNSSGGPLLTSGMASSGAYYGSSQPNANTYVFGLVNNATPTGVPSDYNLGGTSLTAGTSLTLSFTGLAGVPDYIAYTGGALTSYSYTSGTLSLSLSTIDPVASSLDPTGNTLGSAFGLMIVSGSSHNFGGTVFRTDMFWNDITPLQNYPGTSFAAGFNANGQNGATASFYAYLPTDYLGSVGITSPADCEAMLQKSAGSGVPLTVTRTLYMPANPGFPGEGTLWTYGGAPGLNFDGTAGADSYVLALYSNASWSDGNVGITAVPEPSTYALVAGALSLLAVWRHRATRSTPGVGRGGAGPGGNPNR